MNVKHHNEISVKDYLDGEEDSQVKHEYVYGQVYAMAGASDTHNTIAVNIAFRLTPAARAKNCRVYTSDMKFRSSEHVFYYPDVMFTCEETADAYYKTAPCVVVEVLSKQTSRIDLNEKRLAYLEVPSLQLYLIVDSQWQRVKGYYRSQQGWLERNFAEDERVPIPCADIELSIADIYIQTAFAPSA